MTGQFEREETQEPGPGGPGASKLAGLATQAAGHGVSHGQSGLLVSSRGHVLKQEGEYFPK